MRGTSRWLIASAAIAEGGPGMVLAGRTVATCPAALHNPLPRVTVMVTVTATACLSCPVPLGFALAQAVWV
jgi:hypothetical protein